MGSVPIDPERLEKRRLKVEQAWNLSAYEASYFVFAGTVENRAYNPERQNINILLSNGKVSDVSHRTDCQYLEELSQPVAKHYICYPKKGV